MDEQLRREMGRNKGGDIETREREAERQTQREGDRGREREGGTGKT